MKKIKLLLGGLLLATSGTLRASQVPQETLEFRNTFLGAASQTHSDAELLELNYLPGSELLSSPQVRSAEEFLGRLSSRLEKVAPRDLYSLGASTPANLKSNAEIEAPLRKLGSTFQERLTIVIVPGVFGEIIKTRAFEDIFSLRKSAYRDFVSAQFAKQKSVIKDSHYSLADLKDIEAPLQSLIHVSSIDDQDGQALVNVILFDTPTMSLESMGDIRLRAGTFTRRLEKFFSVVGQPKNIAFVGYSRGAAVALEMLARAKEQQATWLKNTRGLVSLGGVIYGSELADDAMNAGYETLVPAAATQLQLLKVFRDSLQEVGDSGFVVRHAIMISNTLKWANFLRQVIQLNFPEKEGSIWSRVTSTVSDLYKFIEENFKPAAAVDVKSILSLLVKVGIETFELTHPVATYDLNIKRLRVLVDEVIMAVTQLSTQERLEWWSQNILPTDGINYYAVAATMVEPEYQTSAGYNNELYDDHMLNKNYKDIVRISEMRLNDSQVATYKARFWPEINLILNPSQPPMKTQFLGVLGTHHWGLALRVVNETAAGKVKNPYNPFPRAALLKALASTVAKDVTPEPMDEE